jgi:divalent metal cation (Fe/Co/Zn/Cd) transporter
MVRNMRALDWFLGTAALVSLIGGLLLGYQWGQPADASIVKALPASLEMMQLLRDEHRLIANMLESRIEIEKKLAYGEASN